MVIEMTCSTYTDYSARKNCPLYDLDNCPTPQAPILCPLLENVPRSPCIRYICSTEAASTTTMRSTTSASVTARSLSTFGAFVLPLVQSSSGTSNEQQQVLLFFHLTKPNI